MDISVFQIAWQCVSEHYPQLAAGVTQVIGGATILYRLLGSQFLNGASGPAAGSLLDKLTGLLGSLALNKK
jgi:hypothetical protein